MRRAIAAAIVVLCGIVAYGEEANSSNPSEEAINDAVATQEAAAEKFRTSIEITNSIDMTLRLVPPGAFIMGSSKSPMEIVKMFDLEEWRTSPLKAEHPRHQVQITQPFYLGATEVTQEQYAMVMENEPWSDKMYARAYKGYPATYVSWDQATAFCKRLSEREGRTYRLPTEAEWEYACRAGADTAYCFGNKMSQLSEYAWFNHNADEVGERYAHKVGWKNANAFGLYDMHGNVWEWCADWYSETYYRDSPVKQPLGPANGVYRINRGGSWGDHASRCRSAVRSGNSPEFCDYFTGFRVALVPSSGIGE